MVRTAPCPRSVPKSSTHPMWRAKPRPAAIDCTSSTNRVLPIPGSPRTTRPRLIAPSPIAARTARDCVKLRATALERGAAGRVPLQTCQPPDVNGAVETLHDLGAKRLVIRRVARCAVDFLRDESLPGAGSVEQPRRNVRSLAGDSISTMPVAADGTRDDLPHGETNMDGKRSGRGRQAPGTALWTSRAARTARNASSP